jgi:hypothetical protein
MEILKYFIELIRFAEQYREWYKRHQPDIALRGDDDPPPPPPKELPK